MATKIRVVRNGTPVTDVHVLVGELVGERLKTNAEGKVSFDLTLDWQGYVNVLLELPEGINATALVHIKEGKTHDVDVATLPQA